MSIDLIKDYNERIARMETHLQEMKDDKEDPITHQTRANFLMHIIGIGLLIKEDREYLAKLSLEEE